MSKTANVNDLFKTANQDGNLSARSLQALNLVDPGAQIQHGLGVDVGDIEASEVLLLKLTIDDSSSIRFVAGNTEAVRDGHNLVLEALAASKQAGTILASTSYLNGNGLANGKLLFPFVRLKDATRMESSNYNPDGCTPLYDQVLVNLGAIVAKTQEFQDNGVPVRSISVIVTDGADVGSRARISDVRALVDDLLKQEVHVVCAVGIDDKGQGGQTRTDFRAIFQEMGIPEAWILTPGNTPSEIRKAFQVISQSAVRLSQAANFSKGALGGFGG